MDDNINSEITLNIKIDNLNDLKYLKNMLKNIDNQVTISYLSSTNV